MFAHKIAPGHTGQMDHFWSTCNAECEGALMVRYYIDGEENASIAFEPGMAAGSGFDDPTAPWGTKWIGHGAHSAWFHNFKIPFQKTIRITAQRPSGTAGGFYCIVRGVPNVPINLGGVAVPTTARLVQVSVSRWRCWVTARCVTPTPSRTRRPAPRRCSNPWTG